MPKRKQHAPEFKAMVAAVGKGEAFDRARDFAAWVGLVPWQFSTGGRAILGRITKRGSRYLRMLFVQAAKGIMMRPQSLTAHWVIIDLAGNETTARAFPHQG